MSESKSQYKHVISNYKHKSTSSCFVGLYIFSICPLFSGLVNHHILLYIALVHVRNISNLYQFCLPDQPLHQQSICILGTRLNSTFLPFLLGPIQIGPTGSTLFPKELKLGKTMVFRSYLISNHMTTDIMTKAQKASKWP